MVIEITRRNNTDVVTETQTYICSDRCCWLFPLLKLFKDKRLKKVIYAYVQHQANKVIYSMPAATRVASYAVIHQTGFI